MKSKPKSTGISRRSFLHRTALAAVAVRSIPSLKALGYKSPNEKLNLAASGAGGQPFGDLRNAHAGVENVVALTDVDWSRGAAGFAAFPKAAKYKDFRQMLDKSGKGIDAVVIGTADHMHAACALACMQLGKHVYVEKPLTRTPWEARLLTQAAEKYNKVATQMGNQGYSHDATRVAAYLARSPGASTGDNHSAHCRDWVRACKGGAPACSNFSIAGKYTEWLLLGAVAVHYEGKLLWDAARGEITNVKEANQWVKPTFRKGWELAL